MVANILTQKVEAPIILINFDERWRGYSSINTGRQPSGESFHLRANLPSMAIPGAAFDIPPVRSNPTHEKQYDEDDQNDADDTDAAVTEAVAVAAEATTEATKQEDDEEDDEYESDRHDLSPVAAPKPNIEPLRTPTVKTLIGVFHYSFSREITLLPAIDRGEWSSAAPSQPSVRPSKLSGRWLFGRLPVEMLFVCLCICLGGVHYAIAMVRWSIKRIELHRA